MHYTSSARCLIIIAPIVFAHVVLCGIAARFALVHPQVELKIIAEGLVVNPLDDGYNLLILIGILRADLLPVRPTFGEAVND